ncbi:hypothetical protein E9549_05535 [Blastococcus sp. MG754426]|uniref:8-oxoguanine DNA glycosylase n=1 Tax=unclassified Blastococcus TaxID=2619396 RepID=UPI001EF08FE0|nr:MULTISPECIES: hypothetical protein [unclassified Blastococcus]MCF6506868.1 hypothetical protein [Blastococcus sp. MG754426]MCF6511668.1 hypothetical protein [Blastococcus sp. MG754427]
MLLAEEPLARSVVWGHPWQVGTAAHWCALTQYGVIDGVLADGPHRHRLGTTLREEVAACLLGGFGLPFELGLAAFRAVRDSGALAEGAIVSATDLEVLLRQPLQVGGGTRRYRFPRQRSQRLAAALAFLDQEPPPDDLVEVRDWLTSAPGIGPKTASWIVRNHYGCEDVAVLDIHVLRAGASAGVFDRGWTAARSYYVLERLFLAWAEHGGVSPADLDAVIWAEQALAARRPGRRRTTTIGN